MANLVVTDLRCDALEHRALTTEQLVGLEITVSRERADRQMIPAVVHIREITNSTHVHQHTGCGEAQLHERQQRHPTSKDLRLVTVLSERSNHLVDRAGAHVLE